MNNNIIDIKTLGQVENYLFNQTEDVTYVVDVDANINITNGAYVKIIDKTDNKKINYNVEAGSTLKLLILDSVNSKREFNVKGELLISQIAFNKTEEDLIVNLNDANSNAQIKLLSINNNIASTFKQRVNHNMKNTFSNISNYGIAFNKASIYFDTVGFIAKGNAASNCRQLSKGVVMDDDSKVTSKPILLIDEFDCFASHGAAIGKMSDADLFYLMSRGLTKNEAFKLILNGIIRPFLDEIDNEEIRKEINQKINELIEKWLILNNYKNDFEVLTEKKLAYLDNAAMALKPRCVVEAIDNYYSKYGCNVHRGVYALSYEATEMYEEARGVVANFINANEEEIVFTKGTTNSLNLIALSYGMDNINEGDEIITSELEHHSSHMPWFNVAQKKKAILKYVPLDEEGRITVENFKKVLTNKTKVVALNIVSNVMGYLTPIKEITKLAHEVGAIVIADGAQAVPHMKIDVKDLDCDFLAFSGHKLCGPTGIGVLYGKYALLDKMEPIEFGGDMADEVEKNSQTYKAVPYKFEAGTPNVAGVIGLKEAIRYILKVGMDNILKKEYELKKLALDELLKLKEVEVYNKTAECGLLTFNIKGIHPHDAASIFDKNGVCIRAGHHCAQLITKWLGVVGTIRASFYFYNDEEDVKRFVDSVKETIEFFSQF